MLDAPLMKRLGVTPAKLILIAVLTVVLVGVVVWQWPSSKPALAAETAIDASVDTTPSNSPLPGERTLADDLPAHTASETGKAAWPEMTLDQIVENNPFLLPVGVRPRVDKAAGNPTNPQDMHNRQVLQKLSEAEGGIVLMAGGKHVARIGATTLRTGDKIGPYRVAKIDATGVWLVDENETPQVTGMEVSLP